MTVQSHLYIVPIFRNLHISLLHKFKSVPRLKYKTHKPATKITADNIFLSERFALQRFWSRELHPSLFQSDCQCPERESVRSPKNCDRDRNRCISQPLRCRLCCCAGVASDFNRRNLECRVGDRIAVRRIGAIESNLGDRISAVRQSAIEFP
ncbi:hypothetical protein [Microcoleus asticus]|uniref:hypothetical protein n=1 Tax=Microcoleus asticus TaxID=2815231 RepID=UPI0015539460|nr:hypothetical protein [Microcoleus asticus]